MGVEHVDVLDWTVLAHAEGCVLVGKGWHVRQYLREHIDGRRLVALQAVCPALIGCGAYHEWVFDLSADVGPESGERRSGMTIESGPVEHIGYGVRPIKIPGKPVWLHPGPPLIRFIDGGEGPEYYQVTRSPHPPTEWEQVLGRIGPARRRGRQVKSRWFAATGYGAGEYGRRPAYTTEDLSSRGAAVAWVLQTITTPERNES